MIDFSQYKIRCSSIGKIMTNMPGKKDTKTIEELSETAKTYLIECYVREKYGRDKEIISKYLEKGLQVEEDGITLYSRVKKTFFKKNGLRIENEFLSGHPDIYIGESIFNVEKVPDIKSSWDIWTYFEAVTKPINKGYYYQIQGYCALTGAKEGSIVYCLTDTPDPLILDEQKKLQWKMGVADPDNHEVYKQAADYIYSSMKFEDIPLNERCHEKIVLRSDEEIDRIYNRVAICREFLNSLNSIL